MKSDLKLPIISIIVPTYRRNDLLIKCLDRLHPTVQGVEADLYKVVVTDDDPASSADSLIAKNYPWVHWVPGPHKGPAANRNNGANYAQSKWIAFTDDDCLPDATWLQAYLDHIASHPEVEVLEGKTVADRPRIRYNEEAPINETGGNLWSCNFAIRSDLFTEMGGFDERFLIAWGEDMDLNYRLKARGATIHFVADALVCHPWRQTRFQDVNMLIRAFKVLKSNNPHSYHLIRHLGSYSSGFPRRFIELAKFGFKGTQVFLRREVTLVYAIFAYNLNSKL